MCNDVIDDDVVDGHLRDRFVVLINQQLRDSWLFIIFLRYVAVFSDFADKIIQLIFKASDPFKRIPDSLLDRR